MSNNSTLLSVEVRSLIDSDSSEHSNERKEERSEVASVPSAPLSVEAGIMINSDSLE